MQKMIESCSLPAEDKFSTLAIILHLGSSYVLLLLISNTASYVVGVIPIHRRSQQPL